MQTVETPHDSKVGYRKRPRQVIDAVAADAQSLVLLGDRQIVLSVAPSKSSFSSINHRSWCAATSRRPYAARRRGQRWD